MSSQSTRDLHTKICMEKSRDDCDLAHTSVRRGCFVVREYCGSYPCVHCAPLGLKYIVATVWRIVTVQLQNAVHTSGGTARPLEFELWPHIDSIFGINR